MSVILASPTNSTSVRFLKPAWTVLRAYFAVASRLLPELARRQAERLFTTPPRYAGRSNHPADARRETVVIGKHSLAVWQAGPPDAAGVASPRLGRAWLADGQLRCSALGQRIPGGLVRSSRARREWAGSSRPSGLRARARGDRSHPRTVCSCDRPLAGGGSDRSRASPWQSAWTRRVRQRSGVDQRAHPQLRALAGHHTDDPRSVARASRASIRTALR